jgi:RNA polymerase sigma factor (sigma-70 family)
VNNTPDQRLLRDYADRRSEAAFNEFVRRYIDFVYSAALRITSDRHLAEDVTQAVFVAVARDARKLAGIPVLPGWLHRTARNIAANAVRSDIRRRTREQESVAMNLPSNDSSPWERIAPHLDAALANLPEPERDAVLLRYFQKKSLHDVGAFLSLSDDAAQKRVSRALEKIRAFFAARGVTIASTTLATSLSLQAVHAAPAALAAAITAAATLGTASVAVTTLIPATTFVAMTTLQKTAVGLALAFSIGFAVKESRENSQLRTQLRALQQQQTALTEQLSITQRPQPASFNNFEPAPVVANISDDEQWTSQLLSLNSNDWRRAFAIGQKLATLEPNRGWTLLHNHWNAITNISARQQLLKAFAFAHHQRLPAALHLALIDPSPEVQNWSLTYLKDLALQDFSANYNAGLEWISARNTLSSAEAFADAVAGLSTSLHQAQGEELRAHLEVLRNSSDWLAKYPETILPNRLDESLATIINRTDPDAAKLALDISARLPLDQQWRQSVVLDKLAPQHPWPVRAAAASSLGRSKSEWALDPLLNTLAEATQTAQQHHVYTIATALAELGSPRAIPNMIALLDADRSGRAHYDIGYFGLGKLTGVPYDVKHDGQWWRNWWNENRHRFPADVQSMEISSVSKTNTLQ